MFGTYTLSSVLQSFCNRGSLNPWQFYCGLGVLLQQYFHGRRNQSHAQKAIGVTTSRRGHRGVCRGCIPHQT